MFGQNYTPSVTSESDTGSYELGVKFQTSVSGWVAGVRFYKGSGNTGTHTGSLWTASGTRLATGTFTNETASGWQTLNFTNAVQISANTTYVVSYTDPTGHYSADSGLFYFPYTAPPFTAPKTGVYIGTTNGNGVYNAGGPGFPTNSYNASSYAVDVVFDTTQPKGPPPSIVSASPVAGSSSNPTSTAPSVTFSEPVTQSSVTFTVKNSSGNTVPGTVSWDSTSSVATFTPSAALANNATYTVSVSGATDQFGQTMTNYTATFITSRAFPPSGSMCPCTIWPDVTPSGVNDATDSSSVELGVQFTPATDGTITGVRFYKTPDNAGTHTGTLWNANGTQLATGTFTSESTQGWQELDFTTPVTVTAGTTYVASYHTNGGHYAATMNGLSSSVTGVNSMLTAAANGGVYAYGSSTAFPSGTFNSSNYWVDAVFQPDSTPLTVSSTTPGNQATGVRVGTSIVMNFNKPIKSGSATFTLTGPSGAIAGSTSLNSTGKVLTFTPSSALSAATSYTASVSGAVSTGGVVMTGSDTWSFVTSGVADCPCSIFESDATPANPDVSDSSGVELGVQFQADTNGYITGIRFYKGTGNTGTHTGTLWTSTGTQLATGTFGNETASGWQTLTFSTPVAVTAGTTYVAGYYAPNGNYAADGGFFNQQYDNSPLHALSGQNGLYLYGSSAQFPTQSYNSTNYYVDVVFTTQAP
jgi:methionine-rich copper-binding protein CopC